MRTSDQSDTAPPTSDRSAAARAPCSPARAREHWSVRPRHRVMLAVLACFATGCAMAACAAPLLSAVVAKLEGWGLVEAAPPEFVGSGEIVAGRAYSRAVPTLVTLAQMMTYVVSSWLPLAGAVLVYDRLTARRLRADGLPRCRRCGYLLVHLESARCPECGSAFDAAELKR